MPSPNQTSAPAVTIEALVEALASSRPADKQEGPSKTLVGIGSAVLCFMAIHFFGKFDGSQENITTLSQKVTLLEASVNSDKKSTDEKLSEIQATLTILKSRTESRYTAVEAGEDLDQLRKSESRNNEDLQRQIDQFRELQKKGLQDIEAAMRTARENKHLIELTIGKNTKQ